MQYDPIKHTLGSFFNFHPFLRIVFYKLLGILLLRTWHIKKEINSLFEKSSKIKILDAGSGFGQYSYFLATKFPQSTVLGLDIKEDQIKDCNDFSAALGLSGRLSFKTADLTQFIESNQYDLILSVDVMEHIQEDRKTFSNMFGSLKKGGVLLISTPSDQGGSDVHEESDSSFIDEHVRDGYNLKEIEEKLKTAGFIHINARYSYGTPGKISWKISMKIPIILLNKSRLFFIILPFYYLICLPFFLILNYMDLHMEHKKGTGLIVKAVK
jgi:2-polyprenyl-3-methyl-5-hydroxy-6-metoxy-1,4-benzoquinol methylase